MIIWRILSIGIQLIRHCRRFLRSWIRFIAPSASHRRNELEKWARDAAQPRRGFARWYLAQSELRAGRREEAIRQFEQIRRTTPAPAVLAPALLQYARLQIEAGRVNEALAILSEAGKTNPTPQVREQIDFESGRAMYAALKFQDGSRSFRGSGKRSLRPRAGSAC